MDPGADDRDRRETLLQLGPVEPGQPAVDHLEMPALVHRQGMARDEPCHDVQVTTRMRHPYRVGDVALLFQPRGRSDRDPRRRTRLSNLELVSQVVPQEGVELIGRSRLVEGDDQVVRELELAQAAQ